MLSTVLYYELAMKVPIPVGITVYLLTWGLGHLRCLVLCIFAWEIKSLRKMAIVNLYRLGLLYYPVVGNHFRPMHRQTE